MDTIIQSLNELSIHESSYAQLTTTTFPFSSRLADLSRIPVGLVINPFPEGPEEQILKVETHNVDRCVKCGNWRVKFVCGMCENVDGIFDCKISDPRSTNGSANGKEALESERTRNSNRTVILGLGGPDVSKFVTGQMIRVGIEDGCISLHTNKELVLPKDEVFLPLPLDNLFSDTVIETENVNSSVDEVQLVKLLELCVLLLPTGGRVLIEGKGLPRVNDTDRIPAVPDKFIELANELKENNVRVDVVNVGPGLITIGTVAELTGGWIKQFFTSPVLSENLLRPGKNASTSVSVTEGMKIKRILGYPGDSYVAELGYKGHILKPPRFQAVSIYHNGVEARMRVIDFGALRVSKEYLDIIDALNVSAICAYISRDTVWHSRSISIEDLRLKVIDILGSCLAAYSVFARTPVGSTPMVLQDLKKHILGLLNTPFLEVTRRSIDSRFYNSMVLNNLIGEKLMLQLCPKMIRVPDGTILTHPNLDHDTLLCDTGTMIFLYIPLSVDPNLLELLFGKRDIEECDSISDLRIDWRMTRQSELVIARQEYDGSVHHFIDSIRTNSTIQTRLSEAISKQNRRIRSSTPRFI